MREIDVATITQNIKEMCIEANHFLTDDMKKVFNQAVDSEESPLNSLCIEDAGRVDDPILASPTQ